MNHRDFLGGVAVGLIIASISSYYYFCRPEALDTKTGSQSVAPAHGAGAVKSSLPIDPYVTFRVLAGLNFESLVRRNSRFSLPISSN